MVSTSLFVVLLAIATLCAVLALTTTTHRIAASRREQRMARLLVPIRPLLLRVGSGEDDEGEAQRQLAAVDPTTWTTIEPFVVAMLAKFRGEAHQQLVELLLHHGTESRALRGLRQRSPIVRARAAETLGLLGQPTTASALSAVLHDHSSDVRHVAVRAVGLIGDPTAAPMLLMMLDGSHRAPAQAIAQALLRIGPVAAPTLIAALGIGSDAVRAVAVEILGHYQAVEAVRPLATVLDEDRSTDVRVRAATALGRLGHPAGVEPLLTATGSGSAPMLRAAATAALGQLGAAWAIPRLVALLDERSHPVARNAAAALARLGPAGMAALLTAAGDGQSAGPTVLPAIDAQQPPAPPRGAAYAAAALATSGQPFALTRR
jgi:HEAT repeat protein